MVIHQEGGCCDPVGKLLFYHEVQGLFYHEAALLDDRKFEDWLGLLTDDVRYRMPARINRYQREGKPTMASRDEAAYFDETKESLEARVRRLATGMAWADDPPSRTRHLVTNIVLDPAEPHASTVNVKSSFLLYSNRLEHETTILAGERHDRLRRTSTNLKICERVIFLDQNVLLSKNISTFL